MKDKTKISLESKEFLLKISDLDVEQVYQTLETSHSGLPPEEIEKRLEKFGKNDVAREKPLEWYWMILNNFKNPFILVLIVLGTVSYLSKDMKGTILVTIMILLSVLMRFIQEFKSSRAAEVLRAMVSTSATVKRSFPDENLKKRKSKKEIPIEEIVPGDIIYLSAGDMVPADVRLIRSKDIFISQSALTGESMPIEKYDTTAYMVEKTAEAIHEHNKDPLARGNLCFMGTNVISGFGKAVVIHTGSRTYFGSLAKSVVGHRSQTSFDRGINNVTWVLIKFILVMVPIIFIVNGLLKGDWKESFLFAIAVAVGLTPEMLPTIVTANLAKGAVSMSRFKVIVKRLNSIQSLGAMNILCTDKTGTLTQDKIILEKYLDAKGEDSVRVLEYGFLNSYYQSGLKNMLDRAVLEHGQLEDQLKLEEDYKKIDEIPFDFYRKRLSVVLKHITDEHLLVCKGSVEEVLGICSSVELSENNILPFQQEQFEFTKNLAETLSNDGFRVIAVAYKTFSANDHPYSIRDEKDLTLIGLMSFLDPPKDTAKAAIKNLRSHNVQVKVLTGDNEIITRRICKEVSLPSEHLLLGPELEIMTDEELSKKVDKITVFARLNPLQKSRIIQSLQKKGHIVGFLGDGINDAAGLRDSDVGISVDTSTDIARESADIILLEKSLMVLGEGVIKGREVYGNIIKYIKMTASSNFGNVLSIMIASAFLPFLPLLPLQLMIQNLLYDFSQLSIPWDRMDKEFLKRTRKWDPKGIARFMLAMGPISSIFDLTTFALMWYVFHANSVEHQGLFQSGWFVEGLLSQTLIVHMIRTKKIPFIQSSASLPVMVTTVLIMAVGLYIPFSYLGAAIRLGPLPEAYFIWLLFTLLAYCIVTQLVKGWYIKRFRSWL